MLKTEQSSDGLAEREHERAKGKGDYIFAEAKE